MSNTIAVVFDFDDTIAPDSTTHLLQKYDIDPMNFWHKEFQRKVQNGYDPTVAYLSLVIDYSDQSNGFDELTLSDLEEAGQSLDDEIYPGIPELFNDLDSIVEGYPDVSIEYYVISEAIESLIKGTSVSEYFTDIYASRVAADTDGVLSGIMRPISFTDKTRYLYEINKGISSEEARENPFEVNREIPEEDRHVPFNNIIYVGDGITDIPCFSLVKDRGGRVFGVTNHEENSIKQNAILDIGSPRRAGNLNIPDYTEDGRLGSLLRLTIEGLCTNNTIDKQEAL